MENKPKTVTVHRAIDEHITPCTIVIGERVSEIKGPDGAEPSLPALANVFSYEADAIADALHDHLPQGVAHRVLIRMMQRHASQFTRGPIR